MPDLEELIPFFDDSMPDEPKEKEKWLRERKEKWLKGPFHDFYKKWSDLLSDGEEGEQKRE